MKLEMATFPVNDVQLGNLTRYKSGILEINKGEVIKLILEDKRIASADLDLVFPGEKTRVVNLRDAVEPRIKVSGPSCVFPGIMGAVKTTGQGRTHRLSGVTVMPSAQYNPMVLDGLEAQSPALLDMWGPGAEITPFALTINIIPILTLVDGVNEMEAHAAIQLAELKVAHCLAETTRVLAPKHVEVFELNDLDQPMPRAVYVLTCCTTLAPNSHSGTAYYGLPIRESLPTLMHPNEFLDGALTTDVRRGNGGFITTWAWMNNPIILKLLREHGQSVDFLGVILQRTRFSFDFGKQITAECTSQLARMLKADTAIITRLTPGGNNFMDIMLTVQSLELKDIKTVFITPEWGGTEGTELPLVFYVPEAVTMVSTGSHERPISLPAPDKVIGVGENELVQCYVSEKPFSPWKELFRDGWRDILGGIDWLGGMNLSCREY